MSNPLKIMKALAMRQHPLRDARFRRLWMGGTFSVTGDQFFNIALPWLVLQLTGSSIVLGTISMLSTIPMIVFLLLGGAITDRSSPRKVMIATASVRAILVLIVSALIWLNALRIWHLYVLVGCFGIAEAFSSPAARTYIPFLVASEDLAAAYSTFQVTFQTITLVSAGPVGIFIKVFGIAWAFFIDAISFVFDIAALWTLPESTHSPLKKADRCILPLIADGLRYVKNDGALTALITAIGVLNFAVAGPLSVGLPYIAKQRYGTSSSFGFLMSAVGAGSLIGMLLSGLRGLRNRGRLVLAGFALIGIVTAAIGVVHDIRTLSVLIALLYAVLAFLSVQITTWIQQRIDRNLMGRVMSVLIVGVMGLTPVSMALTGMSLQFSVPGVFIAGGAMVLVVDLSVACSRSIREID